jgi:hypothetical protein
MVEDGENVVCEQFAKRKQKRKILFDFLTLCIIIILGKRKEPPFLGALVHAFYFGNELALL